ncbi:MAG: flagellar protein FliT [Burkholderiaceae bacterium]|nr:flagellar protein FliT [Burkholderiaceae bacterium]MEB2317818.1 flagellar protein FliT [Pseudomonadota bacterium]
MPTESAMLQSYRAVVETAEAMLAQAREGRWDEVARSARTVQGITTSIDDARRSAGELSEADEAERVRLLTRLITIDAEVRQLRQPWTRRLDALLGATSRRASRDGAATAPETRG